MKVVYLNEPIIISLIPRSKVLMIDNLTLTLRNEASNVTITPNFTFDIDNKYLKITINEQPNDFKIQNKYEIELKNGEKIVYLGKMIVLKSETSTQNYTYSTQNDGFF